MAASLAAACSIETLQATPYATCLTNNAGVISFRLNEPASAVAIIYTNLTGDTITTNLGTMTAGLTVTNLSVPGNFTVAVTNSAAPGYLGGATLQISGDSRNGLSTNTLRFNAPRGVAINTNPASPYFGRIYVANAIAGTATRSLGDGIYLLNSDYSDAVGQGTNARTGGITAFTNTIPGSTDDGNTPWHLEIGPDDQLYISDFSATNGNIYVTDPDVTIGTNVLAGFGEPGTPNASPNHGRIGSSVITQGSLTNGDLVIYAIDSDINYSGGANHIVKWEVGAGPLPVDLAVTNVDDATLLPDVGVTVDLDRGPDGKFYTLQNRSVGSEGGIFVVDPTQDGSAFDPVPDGLWDEVFDSRAATIGLNGGVQTNDLLRISRAVKISPDGQLMAVIRDDNQIWVIHLVNGIPDLTTARLIATSPKTTIGRDISFDAAGNIYTVSSGQGLMRVYSPGYMTVAQTSSQGTFTVANILPDDSVTITATDANASEPGGLDGDTGMFTFARTGDTSQPLTVNYTVSGTATPGADYDTNGAAGSIPVIDGTITFAAGESSTNVTIDVIDDSLAEAPETVIFTLTPSTNYSSGFPSSDTVTIVDDGDIPSVTITNDGIGSYELIPGRPAKFTLTSPLAYANPLTVNISLTGTAASGVDYTNPATFAVTYPAGVTTANFTVTPSGNSLTNSKTIIANILSGSGYVAGTPSSATNILRADFIAPTTTLFADNFDTDTTANWVTNGINADNDATFNYDYSQDGVPAAPHTVGGTTRGLRLRAHLGALSSDTGISVSPLGLNLPGDYRLRFDLWMNFNGPAPGGGSGSSEYFTAGVGVSGSSTNVAGQSAGAPIAAWGDAAGSCVIFAADGDGGFAESTGDFIAYSNNIAITGADTNVYPAGARDNFASYYAEFGEIGAPPAQTALFPAQTGLANVGTLAYSWHDVVITKQGTNVTWEIDGLKIADVNYALAFAGSNFSLGYEDITPSVASVSRMNMAIVDNLTVESLASPRPLITAVTLINGGANVQIDFSGNAADLPTDYILQSSATVDGPYVDISSSNSSIGSGTFRAVAATSGNQQFYRIKR
ncbi:MAG TPA: Calx-beta domain-containing protein [Candidatus Angelobacter sp.]|nr:Calx-beta domain-containing protein [Candidatus Angelobacter sp.]